MTLNDAIRYADERAAREQRDMVVYHAATDQWGRDAVFYVRSVDDSAPHNSTTAYRTILRQAGDKEK